MEKIWRPTKRQEQFLSLPDTIGEALYGGAAGGGKTDTLMMLPIVRGFYKEPRFKGIIFRRTFPELEHEIIERSHYWYRDCGGIYNQDRKSWKFPSGAIMRFGHVEYESDARKYDSDEYNYMAFDELTSFTFQIYNYITSTRLRSSSARLPAIARSGTNPGNVGHAWVRDRFVEVKAADGTLVPYGSIIEDKKTGTKRIFIQSLLSDNPHLTDNDPDYRKRLSNLPEAERKAKLEGDWGTFEGQVFDDYRETHIDGEPPHAIHVVDPFQIPDWWIRFLAIDWGYEALTCALWGALSPNDQLYVYREYAVKHAKTAFWAATVGQLSEGEDYKDIVLCGSAWQNRGDEQTIAENFKKYSGLTARPANNDRIAGKLLVQEYLRWKEAPRHLAKPKSEYSHELAVKILRNQGTQKYNSYMNSFEETSRDGKLPKLQIFPDCKEFRKVIPLCIYDKKSLVTNKPAEDVREFAGDDPYDTGRYLICSVDNYLGTQVDEGKLREKHDAVIRDFQDNQDWTAYYMRMQHLEALNNVGPKPTRRFHYGR